MILTFYIILRLMRIVLYCIYSMLCYIVYSCVAYLVGSLGVRVTVSLVRSMVCRSCEILILQLFIHNRQNHTKYHTNLVEENYRRPIFVCWRWEVQIFEKNKYTNRFLWLIFFLYDKSRVKKLSLWRNFHQGLPLSMKIIDFHR